MKVEDPAAFRFIFQDDIYLLNQDKNTFVEAVCEPTPVVETEPAGFNYLGGNKKSFLVVVHYPDVEFIADSHFEALQNILKRLEYSLDDIAILNLANYAETLFNDLTGYFKPEKLLLLGEKAAPGGFEKLALNMPARLNNCNALFSYSFDEMMDDQEKKKAFWEKMKQL